MSGLTWAGPGWGGPRWDKPGWGGGAGLFPEAAASKLLWKLTDTPIRYANAPHNLTVLATSPALPFKDVLGKHLEFSVIFGRPGVDLTGNTDTTYANIAVHSSAYAGTPVSVFSLAWIRNAVVGVEIITWSRFISKDLVQVNHGYGYGLWCSFARSAWNSPLEYALPAAMFPTGGEDIYFDFRLSDARPDAYKGDVVVNSLEVRAYDVR